MATAFFGGNFFGGEFFSETAAAEVAEVVRGGKGDNERRRRIIKPTGLPPYREKEGRKTVEERVQQARQIHHEVLEGYEEVKEQKRPVPEIDLSELELADYETFASLNEVDREIATLLRKKLRTDEEEAMLVILMAADL